MAIPVTCKACGSGFQVRDDFAGRRGRCPSCGEVVQVPESESSTSRHEEERRDPPNRSRSSFSDRDRDRDDDRRRDRDRDRDRRRDDDDDFDERSERRRPQKVGYNWRTAASAATPMMIGYILLAVACLVFLICEFGAFGISSFSGFDLTPAQRMRFQNQGPPTLGGLIQLYYLADPTHPIVLLVGTALAIAGSILLGVGHSRFKSSPVRRLAGFSGLGAIFAYLAMGLFTLGFALGLLFLITGSTSTALIAVPFYGAALAAVGILVGQLLQGIALMDLGGRYYSGGLKWFSLGVWIAVAILILLVVIFALTTISGNRWTMVYLKFGGVGRGMGGFGQPAQTNGLYIAFLILSLIVCVVSIFPLNMAKRAMLTGEPPASPPPPPRRRPERDYDDYDDRPRDRDRGRYRDDEDDDRPRRRGRDDY